MDDKPFTSMTKRELIEVLETFESQMGDAQENFQLVEQQQSKTSRLSNEIQNQHDNINSLANEIQQQRDKASSLSAEIQEKRNEYENLKQKIEGLLPGATSAGLASSYVDAQKEKNVRIYWFGFIASLVILMSGYFYYLIWRVDVAELNWSTIGIRATVGLPLLWIAWYCQRSISQIRRIREEYNHKERVMRVYEGFSREIEQLSETEAGKEQKISLVSTIIKAVERNPAQILDPSGTFMDHLLKRNNQDDPENK